MATHPAVFTLSLPGRYALPFVLACYAACYVDADLSTMQAAGSLGVDGAGTRSRTRDLLITSQLLYQLSYTGKGTPL